MEKIITAGELKIGDTVPFAGGLPYDVMEIVRETAKSITIRFCCDWTMIHNDWSVMPNGKPGGMIKTLRKNTKVYWWGEHMGVCKHGGN